MIIKKSLILLSFGVLLGGCAHILNESPTRAPANATQSCREVIKSFYLSDDYQSKLEKSLFDKKLLTRSNKYVTVHHPRLDWLNTTRRNLTLRVKNWNTNNYPAFYIFHDNEIVEVSKKFSNAIVKQTNKTRLTVEDEKHASFIKSLMTKYKNYNTEIEDILNERIILSYNLKLIKKIKLKKDETRNITLTFLKDGKRIDQTFALSKDEKNLDFLIKDLKVKIKDFDGSLLKTGKVKDRVIRQAALNDMLGITKNELEHAILNNPVRSNIAKTQLSALIDLLENQAISPKTYGVYRVTNAVFLREVAALSKLDVGYKKFIETPALKFKDILAGFIKSKDSKKTEIEKIGIFKRVYARISNISPKTIAVSGLGVIGIGVSSSAYFSINDPIITETTLDDGYVIHPDLGAELEATKEIIEEENSMYDEVIDEIVDELLES